MSSYGEAMKRFQQELTEIQKKCKHDGETSDWREPDLLSGVPRIETKRCKICGKILAKRTRCWMCGNWVEQTFEEPFWIQGDGGERDPIGTVFCCEVHKRLYVQTARALNREIPPWIGFRVNTK